MKTELTIIIVNWNGENFLPDCLRSIAENPPKIPYEVIIVDNKSSDRSVEWLQSIEATSLFPNGNYRVIESQENLGYGRANNLAIEQTSAPFMFILNPDTILKDSTLDYLIEAVQSAESVGVSVPRIVDRDGLIQASVWRVPSALRVMFEGLELYRIVPRKLRGEWLLSRHWSYDRKRDIPLASGCALMLKRTMIDVVGAFNPDIFMYGEDMELCYRINQKGGRVVFEPEAEIIHIGGQSSIQVWNKLQTSIKEEEATLAFQERCLPPFAVAKNTLTRIFVLTVRYGGRIIRMKDTAFFNELIPMQFGAFRRSLSRLLRLSSAQRPQ